MALNLITKTEIYSGVNPRKTHSFLAVYIMHTPLLDTYLTYSPSPTLANLLGLNYT